MRRSLGVVAAVVGFVLAGGAAFAQMGPGWGGGQAQGNWPMGWGYGPSGYGPCGPMGPGMMGSVAQAAPIDIDKAREVAQQYVNQYLKGYSIDTILPFTGGMGYTMYSVELKGPNGEGRILHVNPWGAVMPMGGPWRRTG